MITTTIFAIVSGFLAGLIPAQRFSAVMGTPTHAAKGTLSYGTAWNVMAGLILTFLAGLWPASDAFHYTLGIIPVIYGILFLDMLNFPKSMLRAEYSAYLPWPLLVASLGNILIIAAISVHYAFHPGMIVVLFLLFALSSLLSQHLLNQFRRHEKHAEDTRHILEFLGICNGLFLIITGLLFFTKQIQLIEELLMNLF